MSKKNLIALVVVGAVAVLYGVLQSGGAPPAVAARGPANDRGAAGAHSLAWMNASFQRALAASGHGLSLAAQLDALSATTKPQDAFIAYELVRRCIDFAQFGEVPFWDIDDGRKELSPEENKAVGLLCEGLTERMRTSRLDHIALAAKAGIPGADLILLEEGPFGDKTALDTRPDDPLVLEWKNNVAALLRQHADAGELGALSMLYTSYGTGGKVFGKDTTLALGYALASRQIKQSINPDIPLDVENMLIDSYKSTASPAQVASATDAAKAIVGTWRNAHPQ